MMGFLKPQYDVHILTILAYYLILLFLIFGANHFEKYTSFEVCVIKIN